MPGNDCAGSVDQDGIEKSKALDRSSNLLDLTLRMRARVMLIRSKCLDISEFRRGQRNGGIDSLFLHRHGAIPIDLNAPQDAETRIGARCQTRKFTSVISDLAPHRNDARAHVNAESSVA